MIPNTSKHSLSDRSSARTELDTVRISRARRSSSPAKCSRASRSKVEGKIEPCRWAWSSTCAYAGRGKFEARDITAAALSGGGGGGGDGGDAGGGSGGGVGGVGGGGGGGMVQPADLG